VSRESFAVPEITPQVLAELSKSAWLANASARILGATRVGCAVLANTGDVYAGCNVEHRFRSHDIHAETNALSSLVAGAASSCSVVLVVAERQKFTPCGACLDWIFEIGGPACYVGFQAEPEGPVSWFLANELMPHYPC
jgi:cytidine deaminase